MQYKTIVLELIQDRPHYHEQLRQERMLLKAIEMYAIQLKASHEAWTAELVELNPGSSEMLIAAQALEIAVGKLEEALPSATPPDENEPLPLEGAMASILRAMPTA